MAFTHDDGRHTTKARWLCKLAARGVVASTLLYAVVALAVLLQALELTRWGALPSGALGLGVDHFAVSGVSVDPSASGLSVSPDEVATLSMRLRARNGLLSALAITACSIEVRGGTSPAPVLAAISLPSPTILSRTRSGLYPADCGGGSCLSFAVRTAAARAYLQAVLGLATGMRQGPGLQGNALTAADLYVSGACTVSPTLVAPPGVGLTASLALRLSPAGLLNNVRETGSSGPGGTWSFAALAEWSGIGLNGAAAAGVFATAAATVGADSVALRLPLDPTGDLLAWYDERQTRLAAAVSSSSSSSVPSLSPSASPSTSPPSTSASPSSAPRLPLLGAYNPSAGGAFGAVYSLAGVNTSALLSPTAMRLGALLCRAVDNALPSAHDSALSVFLARVGVVAGVRAGVFAVPPGTTVVGPGQADEIGGSIATSGTSTSTDLSAAVQARVKYRGGGCDAGSPAMGVSGSVLGLVGPTLDVGIVVGRAGSGAVAAPLTWQSRAASVRIAADCDMEAVGVDGGLDAAEGSRGASPNAVALLRHLMLGLPLSGPAPAVRQTGQMWSCHNSTVPLALVGGAGHPFARVLHGLQLCVLPPWLLTISGVRDSESLPGRGVASTLTRMVGSRTAVHVPIVESSTLSLALGTTRNHVSAHALSPAITWPEEVGLPTNPDAPGSGYVAVGVAGNESWAPAELHSVLSWSGSLLGSGAPSSRARLLEAAPPPSLPVDPMGGMAATFASYVAGSVKAAAWEEVYFDGTDPRDVGAAVQDRCSAELGRTPVAVLASCCAPTSAPPTTSLYFRGTVRLAHAPMRTVLFSSAGEPSPIVAPVMLLWHPAGVNASASSVAATLRPAAVLRLCVQTASDVAPPTTAVPGALYAAGEKMWLRMTASITVLDSNLVWGRTGGADATTVLRSLSDVLLNGASAAQAAGGSSRTALPPSVAAALDAVLGVPAGRSASKGACEVRPPPSRTSGIDAFLSTGLLESAPPSPYADAVSNKWTGHGPWAGTAWRVSLTDPVGLADRLASVCTAAGGSVCPVSLFNASSLGDSAPSDSLMSRLLSGVVGELRLPGPGDGRVWAARPHAPISASEACAAAALAASPTLPLSSSAALSLLGVGDVTGGAGLAGGAGIAALVTDLLAGFPGGFPGPPPSIGWQDYSSPTDTDAAALAATPSWAWAANASLPAPPPSSCPLLSLLTCPPSALPHAQRSTYTQGARIECGLQLPPALCASWRAALFVSAVGASTSAVLADAFPRTFTPTSRAGAAACASLLQAVCGEGDDEVGGFLLASRSIKLPVVVMNVPSFEIGMLSASLQVPSALPPGEAATLYGAHGAKLQVQFDKRSETLGWQTLTWDVALSLSRLDPNVGSSSRTRADGQPVRVRTLPAARATLLASLLTRSRLQTVLATVHRGASIAAPLTLHPASEEEATALVLLTLQALEDAVTAPAVFVGTASCPAPASSVRAVNNPAGRTLLRTGVYGLGEVTDSGMVAYTMGHTLVNALPGMPTTVTGIDGLALSALFAVQVDGQASFTVPLLLAAGPHPGRPPVCSLNLQLKASGVVDGRFGLSEAASSAAAMDGDDGVVTLLKPASSPDGCARSIEYNASAPLPPILAASLVAASTRLQVKDIVRGSASGWMRHLTVRGLLDTAEVRTALAAVTTLNTSAVSTDAAVLSGLIRDTVDAGVAATLGAGGWKAPLRVCATLLSGGPSICISLLPSTSDQMAANPALFHAVSGVVGVSANGLPRAHLGPSAGARLATLSPVSCPTARQLEEEPAAEPAATESEPTPPVLHRPSGPRRAAAVSSGIVVSVESVQLVLNEGAAGLVTVLVLLNLAAVAFLIVEGRWAAKEGALRQHALLQEEDATGLTGKGVAE